MVLLRLMMTNTAGRKNTRATPAAATTAKRSGIHLVHAGSGHRCDRCRGQCFPAHSLDLCGRAAAKCLSQRRVVDAIARQRKPPQRARAPSDGRADKLDRKCGDGVCAATAISAATCIGTGTGTSTSRGTMSGTATGTGNARAAAAAEVERANFVRRNVRQQEVCVLDCWKEIEMIVKNA